MHLFIYCLLVWKGTKSMQSEQAGTREKTVGLVFVSTALCDITRGWLSKQHFKTHFVESGTCKIRLCYTTCTDDVMPALPFEFLCLYFRSSASAEPAFPLFPSSAH